MIDYSNKRYEFIRWRDSREIEKGINDDIKETVKRIQSGIGSGKH